MKIQHSPHSIQQCKHLENVKRIILILYKLVTEYKIALYEVIYNKQVRWIFTKLTPFMHFMTEKNKSHF